MIAYVGGRSLVLFITVAVGVYLVILVANIGGAMDKIREAQIREEARLALQSPQFQLLTEGDRQRIFEQFVETRRREEGLHRPFFLRSFSYLVRGITLDFGRSERINSDSGSNQVRLILLERLPHTMLLWGTSQLLLFFGAVFVALRLSRRPDSALDRVFLALVPTSATPAWLYGILLLLLFASRLQVLPYGGFVDAPPPSALLPYVTSVFRHLALPVLALFLAGFFEMTYVWRGLFLLQAGEDYVETGEAKGLPRRILVRRYILRPSFSPILTAFTLRMIRAWMGGILT